MPIATAYVSQILTVTPSCVYNCMEPADWAFFIQQVKDLAKDDVYQIAAYNIRLRV